jgi:1-deoxy-D-xylulose-5-phosphate synthase
MVYTAIKYEDGPIALRYPRGNGSGVPMDKELHQIPIGTWETLREGKDAAILTFGTTIPMALEAADILAKFGVSVKVVNARFIKPMDEAYLHDLFASNIPILTIEEACLAGGFGSGVLEFAHDNGYHQAVISRMGIPDKFIEHGSVTKLLEEIGLTAKNAVERIQAMVPSKQKRA